jgi:hypothetical protein
MEPALDLGRAVPRYLLVGAARYVGQLASELPRSIRRQKLILAVILMYWLAGLAISELEGLPPSATISTYLQTFLVVTPMMVLALLIGRGLLIMVVDRPARPLTQLVREFRTTIATPRRLADAIPMLTGILVFGGTFTVLKASIPAMSPYAWDIAFEQLDKWLHGGVAPWALLQPILGAPLMTHAINWAYNLWFYFLSLVWVWQAFSQRDDRLREQFFLSLVLGWILLGNVVATLLSSAGPCYFARITGLADPYAPLISYLQHVNQTYSIWALDAQEKLWENYSAREISLGSGISAMPSMHVAMATLFALVCWRIRRWLGIVMAIFAVIIMIGSVHLAWHYAVDGYVSVLGMLLIWWAVGRVLDWRARAAATAALSAA